MKLQHQHHPELFFLVVLIDREPACSRALHSYHCHQQEGRSLEIGISHHFRLPATPPATPEEKLSWDQSIAVTKAQGSNFTWVEMG